MNNGYSCSAWRLQVSVSQQFIQCQAALVKMRFCLALQARDLLNVLGSFGSLTSRSRRGYKTEIRSTGIQSTMTRVSSILGLFASG